MRLQTLPSGVKTIKFTMNGKRRLWVDGSSYLRILLTIPKHWLSERL